MDYNLERLRRLAITGGVDEKNNYARVIYRINNDPQDVVDALGGPATYDFFSEGRSIGLMDYYVEAATNLLVHRQPYPIYHNRNTTTPTQFTIKSLTYEAATAYGEICVQAIWELNARFASHYLNKIRLRVRTSPRTDKCSIWIIHIDEDEDVTEGYGIVLNSFTYALQDTWYQFVGSYLS